MKYSKLASLYEELQTTRKKLEKTKMLADFFRSTDKESLSQVVLLTMGSPYPPSDKQDLGVASKLMIHAIRSVTGASERHFTDIFKKTGDIGSATEVLKKEGRQTTLSRRDLTVNHVYESLRKLPGITGKGSQERKLAIVSELISSSSPVEAKYIVRTTLGNMRTGVAAGLLRDALADAFEISAEEIEEANNMLTNYGEVALIAATKGSSGLRKLTVPVGKPLAVQLADKAESLDDAFDSFERKVIEWKYDGFRVQIHKKGDDVKVFSRRLDDVTRQFPDIVKYAKESLKCKECIIEGEAIAIKDGRPLPFQALSQRIQRKYDIERMVKEVPVQVHVFELLFMDGKNCMKMPLSERLKMLKSIIKPTKSFKESARIFPKDIDEANRFYAGSLEAGQEGLMVKNLDAAYQPGKRVGYWLKVKPIMETLDLVIVAAEWGEGKRANWLSSYLLACRDEAGEFIPVGRMASGTTEAELEEMTQALKKLIISEEGKIVTVRPEIVIEVGYEEIQKSPHYASGFALRFPRLVRFRPDRKADDADTIDRIAKLYKEQRGRK